MINSTYNTYAISITNKNGYKVKKGSGTKARISITIDKSLNDKINKQCEERLMKVSNYIEKLIKIGLQNEK